jgi:hypothetical protein
MAGKARASDGLVGLKASAPPAEITASLRISAVR